MPSFKRRCLVTKESCASVLLRISGLSRLDHAYSHWFSIYLAPSPIIYNLGLSTYASAKQLSICIQNSLSISNPVKKCFSTNSMRLEPTSTLSMYTMTNSTILYRLPRKFRRGRSFYCFSIIHDSVIVYKIWYTKNIHKLFCIVTCNFNLVIMCFCQPNKETY